MILKMKQVRDIYQGLGLLGTEPIETHLLNFRLKAAITLLQPFIENLQKSEEAILLEYCEKGSDDRAARDPSGEPKWLVPDNQLKAVSDMTELLNAEVEVPGLVNLTWDLLEKARCFYINKETGTRSREALVVSLTIQILLGEFLQGSPAEAVA